MANWCKGQKLRPLFFSFFEDGLYPWDLFLDGNGIPWAIRVMQEWRCVEENLVNSIKLLAWLDHACSQVGTIL